MDNLNAAEVYMIYAIVRRENQRPHLEGINAAERAHLVEKLEYIVHRMDNGEIQTLSPAGYAGQTGE